MWSDYRKRPVVIQAVEVTGDIVAVADWCGGRIVTLANVEGVWVEEIPEEYVTETLLFRAAIAIDTLEGTMWAMPGDYIIKGVSNEFYPCKADIFAKTYESVDD